MYSRWNHYFPKSRSKNCSTPLTPEVNYGIKGASKIYSRAIVSPDQRVNISSKGNPLSNAAMLLRAYHCSMSWGEKFLLNLSLSTCPYQICEIIWHFSLHREYVFQNWIDRGKSQICSEAMSIVFFFQSLDIDYSGYYSSIPLFIIPRFVNSIFYGMLLSQDKLSSTRDA